MIWVTNMQTKKRKEKENQERAQILFHSTVSTRTHQAGWCFTIRPLVHCQVLFSLWSVYLQSFFERWLQTIITCCYREFILSGAFSPRQSRHEAKQQLVVTDFIFPRGSIKYVVIILYWWILNSTVQYNVKTVHLNYLQLNCVRKCVPQLHLHNEWLYIYYY